MTQSTEITTIQEYCPNCDASLNGDYCYNCGQQQISTDKLLITMISEAFDGIFNFNSRAWKTTIALFIKPGFLSLEYSQGRRKRYIQPLRLYIITSLVFFLVLSISNYFAPKPEFGSESQDADVQELVDSARPTDLSSTNEGSQAKPADASESADIGNDPEGDIDDEAVQFDVIGLELPFIGEESNKKFTDLIKRQGEKAKQIGKEDPRELLAELIDVAPPIAVVLLPIFALILKIFYLFSGRYYAEHLVLAVHNHCFMFAAMTLLLMDGLLPGELLAEILSLVFFIWMPIYMYRSMSYFYQQGALLTTLKFVLVFVTYMILLGIGIATAVIIGVISL